jgi:hypothetical protein
MSENRSYWPRVTLSLAAAVAAAGPVGGDLLPFRDTFRGKIDAQWRWVREDKSAWRVGDGGLEVRIQPGNNWGPPNDAKNVLVRPAPDAAGKGVEIIASIENKPTNQWEQVDLCWYYDDSNMVKLGQEMVDGQLSIVMGREQADKARTVKIIPIDSAKVELRLAVKGKQVRGSFRTPAAEWRDVGECDLPTPPAGKPAMVSLQFYNGLPDVEHWAKVTEVSIQ